MLPRPAAKTIFQSASGVSMLLPVFKSGRPASAELAGRQILGNSTWRYRKDIDGLRALAVVVVILFHFESVWFPGGFVGVDIFFVISGFLITSLISRQIADGRFSLVDFYERRFRRIYPNLLIVLTVTAVLGFLIMMPLIYKAFGRSLIWATLSGANFVFMGGKGYFDLANIDKPLLHTWSLGVEEQFYLVFPWLLIFAVRRGYSARWLIGGVVTLSLILSVGAAQAGWVSSYFLLPPRFWELGIGALVAILPAGGHLSSSLRSTLGLGGLLAIAWAALRLSESDPFPGYIALVPTLGAAAVIWANGGLASRLLSFQAFVWIGRLSFALYLWHWPLISIAANIGLPPSDTGTRIGITAIMLTLSLIGYFCWEQPIRQRRLLPGRKAFFVTLLVFAVILVGVGIVIFETKGIPQRVPEIVFKNAGTERLIMKSCPKDQTKPYFCPVGAKNSESISFFIIGDSHSEATAGEIGDIAARYGLRGLFFGKGGCRLSEIFTRPDVKGGIECIRQHEFFLRSYDEYGPRLVIAITWWPNFMKDDDRSIIYNGFDGLLSILESSTFVTAPAVPTYDLDIGKFAMQARVRSSIGLDAPPALTMPLSQYRERQAAVQSLLNDEKLKHPNLHVIDPAAVLCPNGICLSMVGNEPLYFDTNHLSHAGALRYAPLFEPFFEELARDPVVVKSTNPPQLPD